MPMAREPLPRYRKCFVCGAENPCGLQGRFFWEPEEGVVLYPFTPKEHHVGWPGRVHGGIIAAALDEAMGWAVYQAAGVWFYTWELKVRYARSVRPGTPLLVKARYSGSTRAYHEARAELYDQEGVLYARAWGKYVPIPEEEFKEMEPEMER